MYRRSKLKCSQSIQWNYKTHNDYSYPRADGRLGNNKRICNLKSEVTIIVSGQNECKLNQPFLTWGNFIKTCTCLLVSTIKKARKKLYEACHFESNLGQNYRELILVAFTTIVLQGQMHTTRKKYLSENKKRVPERNEQRLPYLEFFRYTKVPWIKFITHYFDSFWALSVTCKDFWCSRTL